MAVYTLTMNSASAPPVNGTAGSLIAVLDFCLVTTMGWTKPFTGTNLAVYKQPAGSNGFYLSVDDTGGGNARVVGYETMTAVTTGTGPFPTTTQFAGGGYVYKSNAADTTARPWAFFSDGKIFHLFISYGSAATAFNLTNLYSDFTFGDFKSYKVGDVFNTLLIANTSANASIPSMQNVSSDWSTVTSGHWCARSFTQTGTSVALAKYSDLGTLRNSSYIGAGTNAYPSPIDGGIIMSRVTVGESGQGRRGTIPGIWAHGHVNTILQSGDTFNGAGDLAGRSFNYWGFQSGAAVMETTDTWST